MGIDFHTPQIFTGQIFTSHKFSHGRFSHADFHTADFHTGVKKRPKMVQNRQNLTKSPNLRKNRSIPTKTKKPALGGLWFGLSLVALALALAVHRQT